MELEKAKKILNGNNQTYTDDEIKQILELVDTIATVIMNNQLIKKKVSNEKCYSLR